MKDIINRFDDAYKALEKSDIIKDYISAEDEVKNDRELWSKIREFQKNHVKLKESEKKGEADFGFAHYVSSTYYSLMRDPAAERFLSAENNLLKVLKHIEKGIDEVLCRSGINGFGSDDK